MVSVESMCHLLQEKEKISLISSVPSKLNTREAWQTEVKIIAMNETSMGPISLMITIAW